MDSQAIPKTPKREAPKSQAVSPHEKMALIGEPPMRVPMAETYSDVKAEIRKLAHGLDAMQTYMEDLSHKHNYFVGVASTSFRVTEEATYKIRERVQEHVMTIAEMQQGLGHHHQEFLDCKAMMDGHTANIVEIATRVRARELEVEEQMRFLKDELKKFTINGHDRITFLENHLVPDALKANEDKFARTGTQLRSDVQKEFLTFKEETVKRVGAIVHSEELLALLDARCQVSLAAA